MPNSDYCFTSIFHHSYLVDTLCDDCHNRSLPNNFASASSQLGNCAPPIAALMAFCLSVRISHESKSPKFPKSGFGNLALSLTAPMPRRNIVASRGSQENSWSERV